MISKKLKSKAVVLIPLSGGLDSTFVAYKALQEGYTILPVYLTMEDMNHAKHLIENQQCKKIVSMLKEDFGDQVFGLQEFTATTDGFCSQFDIWVNAIKNNIDFFKINQIHFGPTKSDIDESASYDDMMHRLESANLKLENKAKFPLLDFTKEEIGKRLPNKYIKEVYTCEMPLYSREPFNQASVNQCGKCNACHLHKVNKLTLAGPFMLKTEISNSEIEDHNKTHFKYISHSNFYGQQSHKFVGV